MNNYKVGDRIVYTGDFTADMRGEKGTVTKADHQGLIRGVTWDNPSKTLTPMNSNVEPLPVKYNFKKGDCFRYATREEATSGDWNSYNEGKFGIIESDYSGDDGRKEIRVRFSTNPSSSPVCYAGNLVKVPDKDKIEKALAVLRAAGDVTFKPNKPPFNMNIVRGVGCYNAVISEKSITVGCTNISFEKFDEIAKAVAAARAYNEENNS